MKNVKKTTLCLLMLLAIALVSFGCGEDEKSNQTTQSPVANITDAAKATDEATQKPTDAPTEVPTEKATAGNSEGTATPTATKTPSKTATKAPVVTNAPTAKPTTSTPKKTATKAPVKTPTKTPAATATPTGDSSGQITYNQLVSNLMKEAQIVADYIKAQNFIYGDASVNPAINWIGLDAASAVKPSEKKVSCDRLVCWIFYRVGFTEQPYNQGITVFPFPAWCEQQGFTKSTNVSQLKAGDIVFVNPDGQYRPQHVFLCASGNLGGNVYLRYDAGSDARIQCKKGTEATPGKQPFKEGIANFMYAYRPTVNKLNLANLSKPSSTVAVPKSNATQVFTVADKTWTKPDLNGAYPLNYRYEPGETYSQYELHLKLSSAPSSTDTNYWNAGYIGVRMPDPNLLPWMGKGGIYVAFNDKNASVYFGGGEPWNIKLTGVTLPVSISTARDIIVVDSGEYIKFYIATSTNAKTLFLTMKVDPSNGDVAIWDGDNNLIYTGVATINDWGYFTLVNHGANSKASNIKIYGAN